MVHRVNYYKKSFFDMYREAGIVLHEKYNGEIKTGIFRDIKRLWAVEPIGYVVGRTLFCGATIDLSLRPIVPRPETEWWVLKAIDEISGDGKNGFRCLDMFAGSGCIGIAVLRSCHRALVDFVDIDDRAIEQIKINLRINNISSDRARVIKSDIFKNVSGKYDYIFANPPYVPRALDNRVFASSLKFEPHLGLFSGYDGCDALFRLIEGVKLHLVSEGKIWVEFVELLSGQRGRIEEFLKKNGYCNFQFKKDRAEKFTLYLTIAPDS